MYRRIAMASTKSMVVQTDSTSEPSQNVGVRLVSCAITAADIALG